MMVKILKKRSENGEQRAVLVYFDDSSHGDPERTSGRCPGRVSGRCVWGFVSAKLHPDRNFLGVERLLGRVRKVDRKGRRAALTNLRLVRLEAAYFLEYLIPAASLQALHLYFPDPWPKRKHRRHRLVNAHFAEVVAQALAPGGLIFLRTDSADYHAQVQSAFNANPQFRPVETPLELSRTLTDFERGFHARGVPILRAACQRCGKAKG